MTIRKIRHSRPKLTLIPVDFPPKQLRAIEALAARNGVSVEDQVVLLVRKQLGLPTAGAARLAQAA